MYLTADELQTTYYPKAANMPAADVNLYLARANSYAVGIVGGPLTETQVTAAGIQLNELKTAVGLAFEILAKGETGQVDPINGNITEAAPPGVFVRRENPLKTVETMLKPFAELYDRLQIPQSEKGVAFL